MRGQPYKWDMVPFDVQILGGIVLHQGRIAEMATGEGKTLVATLPLYLNAIWLRSMIISPYAIPSGWARCTSFSG